MYLFKKSKYLIFKTQQTRMPAANLALVFAPSLLRGVCDDPRQAALAAASESKFIVSLWGASMYKKLLFFNKIKK